MRVVILSLVLIPLLVHAITPEEVRQIDDQATTDSRQKSERVSPGNVDQMLPKTEAPSRATKYSTTSSSSSTPSAQKPLPTTRHVDVNLSRNDSDTNATDVAHSRTDSASEGLRVSGADTKDQRYFGIPLGTWFRVTLNRNVTNAETSQVELTVAENVSGKSRVLPAGSILFANKAYNTATKRLDCQLARGITPRGYEFNLRASCYDLQRLAGLNGVVSVDEKAVVKKGIQTGVINTLRTAAAQSMTGSTNAVLAGVSGATDSVLNDHSQIADQSNAPAYTIYVSPQELLIRLDDTL